PSSFKNSPPPSIKSGFITSSNSSCLFMNDRAIGLENRVQRLKELLRNKDEQLNQQAEMINQLSKMLNSKFKKRTRTHEIWKHVSHVKFV
ncbi:98_t:CDS:2, partial [Cetraspora pellucida]